MSREAGYGIAQDDPDPYSTFDVRRSIDLLCNPTTAIEAADMI
jgi:hypothetical protein